MTRWMEVLLRPLGEFDGPVPSSLSHTLPLTCDSPIPIDRSYLAYACLTIMLVSIPFWRSVGDFTREDGLRVEDIQC